MPQATFHFPTGFLWGSATAAHQVEGGNTNNNWSYWENQPRRIINGDKAGRACDWWGGRWRDDFDRAAEGGQKAHRLSIEWSRVQPALDRWNEDALDVYREMLRGLYDRGMMPVVTLHHFTDPLWLFERGGWEDDEAPALFEAFVKRAVGALREYCTTWIPINEPNVYTYSGYLDATGAFPPGKNDRAAAFKVMTNLLRGHALAYKAIKAVQREARVGTSINVRMMQPARSWLPADKMLANIFHQNFNASFLDTLVDGRLRFAMKSTRLPEVIGTNDFAGLNYYSGDMVAFNPLRPGAFFSKRSYPRGAETSETGFIANMPEGIYDALKWMQAYKLPIMITENGIEDSTDRLRPRYIVEHVHQIWRAINYNWPIKGYFHWSQVDNFEWERGWSQRFGLWGLDLESQARIRRPSVDLYAAICKENALSHEMVARYAPESIPNIYPE
jgi:beta-glucosidase